MFTSPESCVPVDWLLDKLGLHPLLATKAIVEPCATQPTQSDCLTKQLPDTFLRDIAKGINEASDTIRIVTGISPCIKFETEVVDYAKYTATQYARHNRGFSKNPIVAMRTNDLSSFKSVHLTRNHYIMSGVRATTEIATDLPVVYLDEDGDGIREIAEIEYTFPLAPDFDVCELHAFFPNSDGKDKFRVKSIFTERAEAGLTVTIRYPSWCLIKPSELTPTVVAQAFNLNSPRFSICCTFLPDNTIDPLGTDCPFSPTVDLYRVFVDTEACPATLSFIGNRCSCTNNSCVAELELACVQDTNVCNYVRLVPSELVNDICTPKDCLDRCCEPDKACIQYVGGCPGCLDIDCFNPDLLCFEDALYWLALAWMKYKPCDCGGNLVDIDTAQKLSDEFESDIDNPFYRTIVRNDFIGERKAWGLLKPFLSSQCNQSIQQGITALQGM